MNATGLCDFSVRVQRLVVRCAVCDKDGVCETQLKINENNAYRVVFLRFGSRRGENTITLNIQIDVLLLYFEKNECDLVAATATGSANHHINIH